jgi:hypothetical protein
MASVSVGDIITAAQYNDLQTRVQSLLGNGITDKGYGQAVTSQAVSIGTVILASHMNDLYADIVKCYQHQQNANPSTIAQLVVTNLIGADSSTDPNSTIKGYNDYNTIIGTLETNRLTASSHINQATVESKVSSSRSVLWGNNPDVITHEVSVTFPGAYATVNTNGTAYPSVSGADHMRHFFNAGGQIRFSAALSSGSGAKYNDWNTMLTNMATIVFNRSTTYSTAASGTPSSIGYANLTTSYVKIYEKVGSGVYAENDYNIAAKIVGTNQIYFRIQFRDDDAGDQQAIVGAGPAGPAVDENVSGTLVSSVGQRRPSGWYVSLLTPSYANTLTL